MRKLSLEGLLELSLKDASSELLHKLEALTQSNGELLCEQLKLLDKWPHVGSHGDGKADFSEVGVDELLKVVGTHCHDEFERPKDPTLLYKKCLTRGAVLSSMPLP